MNWMHGRAFSAYINQNKQHLAAAYRSMPPEEFRLEQYTVELWNGPYAPNLLDSEFKEDRK